MKKFLSLILAGVTVSSVLASCSAPEAGTSITASDGAEKYVSFLEGRLDAMPDSLVIVSGADTAAYGVDADGFVDSEGYTIRANDGDVVILAKTDAGLDRAVRQYANYGNSDSYTFSYGEGYRVQNLTVYGNDIADYGIVIPDDADECMRYAADELVKYVKLATGVTLPVYSASAADKPSLAITFTIDYPAHGDEAFSIDVKENGTIDILCGQYRGCLYGAYGLLHDIGWRFIGDGTEYVYESKGLDLTSEINRTEEAAFATRIASKYPNDYSPAIGNRLNIHNGNWTEDIMRKYGYYGITRQACHGLKEFAGAIDWGGAYEGFNGSQPCFTDEAVLQAIENHFRKYIETRLAAGDTPGKELAYIDVSQFDSDSSGFCQCAECTKVVGREGSQSGILLRMTNRMADMAAEYSPEIDVVMLAYCGTNKPPRSERPRDNVKIAYCFYYVSSKAVCSNHTIAGGECSDGNYSNTLFYNEFEKWKEICPADSLQVWYYPDNGENFAFKTPSYDTIFDDMKYFIESDVDCIMFCEGGNNDAILISVLARLAWDKDLTREEYYELLEEYFSIYYGMESGKFIYDYANLIVTAGDLVGCYNSWGSDMVERVDHKYIKDNFNYMLSLFDSAIRLAESETIQNRIEILKARMLYMAISVVHEDMYTNGTEDSRALISELYAEMHGLFLKHKIMASNNKYAPSSYDVTKIPVWH